MFDTHAHLNFSRFKKNVNDVIRHAHDADISQIVIPGTDVESSKKAVEIAEQYDGIYAAVGIHPHHVFKILRRTSAASPNDWSSSARVALIEIEQLLPHQKVVAVGEIGIDRHVYEETKYEHYSIDEHFLSVQRELFTKQINLAIKHNKSLIIHNREATEDVLEILSDNWDKKLEQRAVFHCCEPDEQLFNFAQKHKMFIGIDGDITYDQNKQEFIKRVPLDMLVLETDSPFLLPEPLRSRKEYPNEPMNIRVISKHISKLINISEKEIQKKTTENAKRLFYL